MNEEILKELKINYLTQEQYDTAKENGELNENELYLTPDDEDNINAILQSLHNEIAALKEENSTLKEQIKVGLNRDLMKITSSVDMTMTAGEYTLVPFDTLWEEVNDYGTFTFLGDGKIQINSDTVKKVHITASVLNKAWGENAIYLEIRTSAGGTHSIRNNYVKGQSTVRNEVDIVVQKGDILSIYFYCAEAITLSNNRVYTQMVVSV